MTSVRFLLIPCRCGLGNLALGAYEMLLYHGTQVENLESILTHGLQPRGDRKGNYKGVYQSHADKVYLSDAYALHFAIHAGEEELADRHLLIEVETERLDQNKIYPDEDFLSQRMNRSRNISLAKAHKKICANFDNYKHLWRESLRRIGNIAHAGAIPVSAITRYAVIEWRKQSHVALIAADAKSQLEDYAVKGELYRAMHQAIFERCRDGVELVPVNP